MSGAGATFEAPAPSVRSMSIRLVLEKEHTENKSVAGNVHGNVPDCVLHSSIPVNIAIFLNRAIIQCQYEVQES